MGGTGWTGEGVGGDVVGKGKRELGVGVWSEEEEGERKGGTGRMEK